MVYFELKNIYMIKNFNSLIEFQKEFKTELKCIKHVISLRWNNRKASINERFDLALSSMFGKTLMYANIINN